MLIVDTAGRLHIDEELMDELAAIRKRTKPHDVLLVLDAMTGQDAVNVAESFAERVDFDGVLLTKLDGDARGGAALSVKAVTGKPILYASVGEKLDQLERFHPERMASRILGMGDMLSLIEKAEEVSDADQAEELERKIRRQQFTLEDFLQQMRQVRRMGPLSNVLGLMPGMGKAMKQMRQVNMDERELDRIEAIILSMTPDERAQPDLIDGSRRKRIARGLRDDRAGGEPARQAVRADAQADGPAREGQDARPAAADARHVTWSAADGRTNQAQESRVAEEPDLAHRRRRPPLAARRSHDRDDRPLQPADRPVDDRGRRRARPALARPTAPSRPARWRGCCAPRTSRPRAPRGMADACAELVEFLARALVDDPDSVRVEEVEENGDLVLEVSVARRRPGPADRQGRAGSPTRSAP